MSKSLVKTQIYLTEEQYNFLHQRRQICRKTLAKQIREAIDSYIGKSFFTNIAKDDPIFKLGASGKSGYKNTSKEHDRYLADAIYRDKK